MRTLATTPTPVLLRYSARVESLFERVRAVADQIEMDVQQIIRRNTDEATARFIEMPAIKLLAWELEEKLQDVDNELFARKCESENAMHGVAA